MRNASERRHRIMETVVARYLETAQPVSSAYICESCGLDISPATVRNCMRELEEEGYLTHPHTSAGRVPTVKCYRYYVSRLMPDTAPDETDISTVQGLIEEVIRENDIELFLNQVASALSEVTRLIGVVVTPSFDQGVFEHLEIVHIDGSRYLIVVTLGGGLVKTISIAVDRIITRRKVEETSRLLNIRLAGLTVSDIKRTLRTRVEGEQGGDRRLLDVIIDRRERIFGFPEERAVYMSGLTKLLSLREFSSADQSLRLAGLFEHKGEIARAVSNAALLDDAYSFDDPRRGIQIGENGLWGPGSPLSLVSAAYHTRDALGTVAVIGPARIPYPRLSAIVRYAADMTARFFA